MNFILFVFLSLLTPITNPVSGGAVTDLRLKNGLIPSDDWIQVPGVPFEESGTFTEITFMGGSRRCFRVLSRGPTAGFMPSIGSFVSEDGYAGYLSLAGVSVSVCDFSGYSISSTYSGFTLEAREEWGLLGEYRSESFLFAGGDNTFTAGVSPSVAENIRIGPAWCHDPEGEAFWVDASVRFKAFLFESAGAIEEDSALRRAKAEFSSGKFYASAGYDGESLFGLAGLSPVLLLEWPDWGISSIIQPSSRSLLCFSHNQGGDFQGELQLSFSGISGGFTLHRNSGGGFSSGFTLGLDFP